jgi:hypothetical protein
MVSPYVQERLVEACYRSCADGGYGLSPAYVKPRPRQYLVAAPLVSNGSADEVGRLSWQFSDNSPQVSGATSRPSST